MAKDMVLIIFLFCFYFFFSTIMSFMALDETLINLGLTNDTFVTDDTNSSIFVHHDYGVKEEVVDHPDLNNLQNMGFWQIFIRIVTFRVSTLVFIPTLMVIIINFINFMSLLIGGLLVFRMMWIGGKG